MPTHKQTQTQTDNKQIKDSKINLIKIWLSIANGIETGGIKERYKENGGVALVEICWGIGASDVMEVRPQTVSDTSLISTYTRTQIRPSAPSHSFHSTFFQAHI